MEENEAVYLVVGDIRRAHGIRGELLVAPATDRVEEVFQPGRTLTVGDASGRLAKPGMTLTVERVRPHKRRLIIAFRDLIDRSAAEMFRGRTLLIPGAEAEPLEEEEYFLHDLVGLEVRDQDDQVLGRVREVYDVGERHLLGVDDGRQEHLVPFSHQIVRQVDLDAGRIVIEPTPGLFDL